MENTYKTFRCKHHPKETIQRVSIDEFSQNPLKCIECILFSTSPVKENIVTLDEFINQASKFYETLKSVSKLDDSAPSELVEFLSDEYNAVDKLLMHVEQEKVKVADAFTAIISEFTNLCNTKREQIFKNLDKQHANLKSNYAYYKSKIEKYYTPSKDEDTLPSKEKIFERISNCSDYEQLEVLIKGIKDDMQESTGNEDSSKKVQEIKEGLKELSILLKSQSIDLPKSALNVSQSYDNMMDKFRKQMKSFMDDVIVVEPTIDEFTLNTGASMDSKCLTKSEDKKMLKKWIRKDGPVRFKLLYRGTRDGFDFTNFHSKCDNFAPTVTVVKSNHGKVFGGYTDQTWNIASNYKKSTKSWLFSVDEKAKYGIKQGMETYGIYSASNYGPTFGGGHDIYIIPNCNTSNSNYCNHGHSYETGTLQSGTGQLAGGYNFQVDEIEIYYVDTKSTSDTVDSTLLTSNDVTTVKQWINDKKHVSLELIYRATQDGFDAAQFHSKCDDQGPTLVVCKSQGHEKVFGGYTSKGWNQTEDFCIDYQAFLFSMSEKKKLGLISGGECATFCAVEAGPIFGAGYDLFICANSNILGESHSNLGITYSNYDTGDDPTAFLAGHSKFLMEEIEVFRVNVI